MRLCAAAFAGIAFSVFASSSHAASFSFTGSFTSDNDVQLFNFSVGATSSVTLRTYSYAGGTNAAGTVIPRGGFDPILALFDATGALIAENDDGGTAVVPVDIGTGKAWDTFLQATLSAGNYTVAVMQYDNFSTDTYLAGGFDRDGQPNFTSTFGCSNLLFCDVSGVPVFNNRTNHWAFDVLGVDSAVISAVPLPAAFPLFATALGVAGLVGWRKKKDSPAASARIQLT